MKPRIITFLIMILSLNSLYAHPHIFIDYNVGVKENGGIVLDWTFDLLESEKNLYYFDDNGDGLLNSTEEKNLYSEGFMSLKDYNYFLTIKVDKRVIPLENIESFKVKVGEDKRLTYTFTVPTPKIEDGERLSISVFDTSYFISFAEPDNKSVNLDVGYYSIIKKNMENPIYYDPLAGRTVVLDTSKPKPGWKKAYPTEILISNKPFLESFSNYKVTLKEKILQLQKLFYFKLSSYLSSVSDKDSKASTLFIIIFAFVYGVIHALGPGHRKIVISSYLLSSRSSTYLKGFLISLGSALIHSGTGILVILILRIVIIKLSYNLIDQITGYLGSVSYISILILSLTLIILKLLKPLKKSKKAADKPLGLSLIILSSLVPCPGAITIMLFSVSIGLIWVGVVSVISMSLGIGFTLTLTSLLTLKGKFLINRVNENRFKSIQLLLEWTGLIILFIFALLMTLPLLWA